MKHLTIVAALCLLLAGCAKNTPTMNEKDMNRLTFDEGQAAAMAAIAANEARGDLSSLAAAMDRGFEAGLSISQMKEAMSQLYAYTGFPRSLNALGTLQRVIEERGADSLAIDEGDEASALPRDYDALRQGTEVQAMLCGGEFNYDFCAAEDYYLKAHLFGDIFARDVLTYADREWVTVSALCGLEGVMPQLEAHVRGAMNMGVEPERLMSLPAALREAGLEAEAQRCEEALATVADGPAEAAEDSCAQQENQL